jgi:hypothetical protein
MDAGIGSGIEIRDQRTMKSPRVVARSDRRMKKADLS